MRSSLALAVLSLACGGSTPPDARAVPKPAPAAKASVNTVPARSPNTLARSEVVRFVDEGFWTLLQHVDVEPSLHEGRFRGWVIVELRPPEFWRGVDLAPGDVVTSVNGLPIERETEAFDAFQSLKTADTLRVAYRRAGTERRLSYRIAD